MAGSGNDMFSRFDQAAEAAETAERRDRERNPGAPPYLPGGSAQTPAEDLYGATPRDLHSGPQPSGQQPQYPAWDTQPYGYTGETPSAALPAEVSVDEFSMPSFAAPPQRQELQPDKLLHGGYSVDADGNIQGPGSRRGDPPATFCPTEEYRPLNADGAGGERLYVDPDQKWNFVYVDEKLRVHPYRRGRGRGRGRGHGHEQRASYSYENDNTVKSSTGIEFVHIGEWHQGEKAYARKTGKGTINRNDSYTFWSSLDGKVIRSDRISTYALSTAPGADQSAPPQREPRPTYDQLHPQQASPSPPEHSSKRQKGPRRE
jgi:hypothetical protein